MTTITEIVPVNTVYPSRTEDPVLFPEKADAQVTFVSITLPTSLNILSAQVNTVAGEVNTNALVASSAASTALAAANATVFNPATPYAAGVQVLDPDDGYASYTSQQGSNTGHTPSLDDETWWKKTIALIDVQGNLQGNLDGQGYGIGNYALLTGDSGTISGGAWAMDYTDGPVIRATAGADISSITITNWPETTGQLRLIAVNFGLHTITFPDDWKWIKSDLSTTTTFADLNITLPEDGITIIDLFRENGIIYALIGRN